MGCLNDQVNMVEREQTYIERCWFLLWFGGRLDVGCRFFYFIEQVQEVLCALQLFQLFCRACFRIHALCKFRESCIQFLGIFYFCDDQNDGITR